MDGAVIMAGALFIVNIPTEAYEKELDKKKEKKPWSPFSATSSITQYLKDPAGKINMDEKPLLSTKHAIDYSSITNSGDTRKCSCLHMQKVIKSL